MKESLPLKHLAVIMDGNGRWASSRKFPRAAGHWAGIRAVEAVVDGARRHGVRYLSLFAFSQDNWKRDTQEVTGIFNLMRRYLERETGALVKSGIRLRVVGDRSKLPRSLAAALGAAEALTANGEAMDLIIAVNYSGQWELRRAFNRMLTAHEETPLRAVDDAAINAFMALPDVPSPDLLIRTGGERRLSNFYLWQIAYTELYFTDVLWPDFNAAALDDALAWYAGRDRRFGAAADAFFLPTNSAIQS